MFNPRSTALVLALGIKLFAPLMQAEEGVPETLVVDFERKTSGFDAYCELKPGAVRYEFEITRVVGDKGTVNSSGVLKDPLAAIENGIVSEDAK